jgi:hypothetical protein
MSYLRGGANDWLAYGFAAGRWTTMKGFFDD